MCCNGYFLVYGAVPRFLDQVTFLHWESLEAIEKPVLEAVSQCGILRWSAIQQGLYIFQFYHVALLSGNLCDDTSMHTR